MELLTPQISASILILIGGGISLILMILALVSIINSRVQTDQRAVWAVVVLAVPVLGAVLYFAIGRKVQ
jgi:hypothetical protein